MKSKLRISLCGIFNEHEGQFETSNRQATSFTYKLIRSYCSIHIYYVFYNKQDVIHILYVYIYIYIKFTIYVDKKDIYVT